METINLEGKRAKANFFGLIVQIMKEILLIIIFMAMVYINGLMVGYIKVIGKIIKWMEKENLPGQTAEGT